VRGRGGTEQVPGGFGVGFMYFYAGEKQAWDSFFTKTQESGVAGEAFVKDGRLYSDVAARYAVAKVFGRQMTGKITPGFENLYNELSD